MRMLLVLAAALSLSTPSLADTMDPDIKIINFTSDYCPNCQVMNPRIDAALTEITPGAAVRIDLDFTEAATGGEEARLRVFADNIRLVQDHKAEYLWDYYGGITGVAVLIASDTGEPMACFTRAHTKNLMVSQLDRQLRRVREEAPGERYIDGTVPEGCP